MKKRFFLFLLIILMLAGVCFAEDPQAILAYALQNSLEQSSFRNSEKDLVFLQWVSVVPDDMSGPEEKYGAQTVKLEYLRAQGSLYRRLEVSLFSTISDISKDYDFLYDREMVHYKTNFDDNIYHTFGKASVMEFSDDDVLKMKDGYNIADCHVEEFNGRNCWKLEMHNDNRRSVTIFWIDCETGLRVREDYFAEYPVLAQRIDYVDYWALEDGTYVEKAYSIWNQSFPGRVRYFQIVDPRLMYIPDEYFEQEILLEL